MARLGPFLTGLFHFSSNASNDTFRYESRVGNTPAYTTILRGLHGLASQAAVLTRERCRDLTRVMWIICDNVQHYHRRRMSRIGLHNVMNIGMAATAWLKPLRYPDALNYQDKAHRRATTKRAEATVDSLLRYIDPEHERRVFAYQWLWVLGEYGQDLEYVKAHALMLLRTRGRIQQLTDEPTEAFPLPSTSGSEAEVPEFLETMKDFVHSTGQTKDDFDLRVLPVGGDGMTYRLLLTLMQLRQFHKSPFTSLRTWNPVLQWWHALWTNLSRIIDKHLVSYSSRDPSTLGYSASKIDRTIRVDQGKYDFHQGSELVYFILDMRVLDCWR